MKMRGTFELVLCEDKAAKVVFSDGSSLVYLSFGDPELDYPYFEVNVDNTMLDSLIELLSMARNAKKENV